MRLGTLLSRVPLAPLCLFFGNPRDCRRTALPPLLDAATPADHPPAPTTTASPNEMAELHWTPLDPESLCAAPCLLEQTLCQEPPDDSDSISSLDPNAVSPRLAKDREYAAAVLEAWREEESRSETVWSAEIARVVYDCDEEDEDRAPGSTDARLFGCLVRRKPAGGADESSTEAQKEEDRVPGVLFFHTAAGPQDVFLFSKAAALVNELPGGCAVLIADLLSDGTGWGWRSDRSRFRAESQSLLDSGRSGDGRMGRPLLRRRLLAAHRVLAKQPHVDEQRIAALGWCFGGHAILELGRMRVPGIRAMTTFHGVFDAAAATTTTRTSETPPSHGPTDSEVLICHGLQDPYVTSDMVETALQVLQDYRHTVSLLQLASAKHGFTNPAQACNPDPSFGYDAGAAAKAWKQTVALLQRRLLLVPPHSS